MTHRLIFIKHTASLLCLMLLSAGGCRMTPTVLTVRLMENRAAVDFTGLGSVDYFPRVRASAAPPRGWSRLPPRQTGPLVHQQWRSPTRHTGLGVAYVRLPLPLTARTLLWIAKGHYQRQSDDGKVIDQWTDRLGRPWFEAENARYHVRGYAFTQGVDAWFVYVGYRTDRAANPDELNLAGRALATIIPTDSQHRVAGAGSHDLE